MMGSTISGAGNRRGTSETAIGAAVWPAFERAVERAERVAASPERAAEVKRLLVELYAVVQRSLAGEAAPAASLEWPAEADEMLDRVRRYFVEELRAERPSDTFGAVHVFSALALVQGTAGRPTGGRHPMDGGAALELAVEAAHDMRSPLAAILFLVDMLRTGRSGAVTERQQQQLGMVYAAALGLNQLACDLLDFVRGEEDIIDREPAPFSVADLLHGVRDIVLPAAEEKGVAVRLVLPAECDRVGSPAALSRILLNLTSNAIRYTREGTVTVAAVERSPTRLEFSVQDAGREIPREVMDQLFQPFRQGGDRGVRAFSGSGLGLAISHRLAAAIGSELRVSTAAGHGARFSFELDLPLATPA